jgi:hypothetical protein
LRKWYAVPIAALALTVGCSQWNDDRGRGDAPVADPKDDTPAKVINFPDRFANIAFKCFGNAGLYVTTRNAPPVIIPDDPNCTNEVTVEGDN